jgi:hypothetical protein
MPGKDKTRGTANSALETTLGELDTSLALVNTDVASGSALSPASAFNRTDNTVDLVHYQSVVWGTSVA